MDALPVAIGVGIAAVLWRLMRGAQVDPREAADQVARGALLVDVRSPDEFAAGHLPDALNVPLNQIGAWARAQSTPPAVVLYCRSGTRSGMAARKLKRLGFRSVFDLGSASRWPQHREQPAEDSAASDGAAPEVRVTDS